MPPFKWLAGPEHLHYITPPPQVPCLWTGDLSDLFVYPDDDRKKLLHGIPRVKTLTIALGELTEGDSELDRLHARAQAMEVDRQP